MTEVLFVEVTQNRMEIRACEIAEDNYAQGNRVQIIAVDEGQAARLDDLLWTFKPDSFIPHGIRSASANEPGESLVITTEQERGEGMDSLLMMDYCEAELVGQFSLAVHMVVVDNRERLEASRRYWTQLKEAGFSLRHQRR